MSLSASVLALLPHVGLVELLEAGLAGGALGGQVVGTDDLDKGERAPLEAGDEVVFGVGIPNGRPLHTCAWRDEFRYVVREKFV